MYLTYGAFYLKLFNDVLSVCRGGFKGPGDMPPASLAPRW
jgi:hypothetical protein